MDSSVVMMDMNGSANTNRMIENIMLNPSTSLVE